MLRTCVYIALVAVLFGCNHDADAKDKVETAADEKTGTSGEATAESAEPADPAATDSGDRPETVPAGAAEAVFAGGCFWCVEAVFEELDGVYEAVSGYAGGSAETADYKLVARGESQHAEAVKIYYDPDKISYETLLEVHFITHDPTTLNRQGNDVGPQYRSAIFFADDAEKAVAAAYIKSLDESGDIADPIVTTLEPLDAFYVAEGYHQDFVCQNPFQGYVQGVALPKVKKVREKFEGRIKTESKIPVDL